MLALTKKTFNPDAIIIGNRMVRFKNWLINPIDRILEERLSVYHHQNTEIRFSTLDNLSTALGATSIAITYFFSENKITKV
ncbi:ROK family protein [Oceanobacillus sp. AG]|uniref:ROK family protein n=1 Tax=Oceanobacillus sp. AG TaxID=2681969 RepID=UPI0012EB64CF|nr:ROK family protein [Oceanobacillus sp. AG]